MVTPVGLGVRVPDIAETLDRAEQWKANRLAQLVQQRGLAQREALGAALAQHGGALFGADPVRQMTALEALVRGGGPEALPLAMPLWQAARQPAPTRERNVGAQVVTEEFDPTTRTWRTIGTSPRWQPQQITPQFTATPDGRVLNVRTGEISGNAPRPDVKDESTLRDRFQALPIVRSYDEVTRAYEAIRDAAPRDTAAADLNIVIGYAKMLDPTSVVREGEQETVRRTGGPADFLVGWVNSLRGGGRLTPDMRASILREAQGRYRVTRSQYDAAAEFYSGLAGRYGFNPQNVVMPRRPVGETRAPSAADGNLPSPRTVQDYNALPSGTRFLAPDGTERVKP